MIPNKVNVAGVQYTVSEVNGLVEDYNLQGQVVYHKGTIKIDANMSEDKKEQTFVHELLHACFNEAGFQQQDEETILRVANVLYQVLKDNDLHFGSSKQVTTTHCGQQFEIESN
ncbi:hypothetical protein B4065_0152 [Caldibacillus thermoamylovorans]|uniref:hypothetical protein n=1 Tax=Caldibacillus thermoamylovorans TaxID=35841 RepID=UPI0005B6B5F4|nr:hypothetical protein [Caldibacillus thermoamylovorans]KIO60226.1 hypothetical protein B4065_0152 [Caldibacillus thermoamylovorans]